MTVIVAADVCRTIANSVYFGTETATESPMYDVLFRERAGIDAETDDVITLIDTLSSSDGIYGMKDDAIKSKVI